MTFKQVSLRSRSVKTDPVHTDPKQVTTDPSPAEQYKLGRKATTHQFAEMSFVTLLILT